MHVVYCVAKTLHLSARLPDEVFTTSGALRQGVLDLLFSLLVPQLLRSLRRSSGRCAATFLFVCAMAAVISSS